MNHRLLVLCLIAGVLFAVVGGGAAAQEAALPIYVEDSPAAADLMAEAARLREQDRYADAAAVYQKVIEGYGKKLLQRDQQRYSDAALLAEDELQSSPELLGAYASVFEPAAGRMLEQAVAQPLPEAGLRETFERYALTPSGRRAGLQLVGVVLERGGASDALVVLDRLGSLAGSEDIDLSIKGLRGVALLLLNDRVGFDALVGQLSDELGRSDHANALRAFANRMRRDGGDARPRELAVEARALAAPLWSVGLEVPETRLSAQQAQAVGARFAMRVVPVVDDGVLYLNESESVLALELRSGRMLWRSRTDEDQPEDERGRSVAQRWSMPDPRGVMVAGERVVAVTGQSATGPTRWRQRPGETQLVCFDRSNGSVRWSRSAQGLDPSLDKAFFQGTPVLDGQRMYVLLRRSQMSGFHDAFIAALRVSDGSLIWRRHLSSAVVGNRYATRPHAQMLVRRGVVYTVDNLGAITCIEGSTGLVRWTRLLEAPQQALTRVRSRSAPARVSAAEPVLLPAGLLVVPADDETPPALLDPDTGVIIRTFEGLGLAEARQLIPVGPDVIAIGPAITRLSGEDFSVQWRVSLGTDPDDQVLGSVARLGEQLILSTPARLVVLDAQTGKAVREARPDTSGNVLALPDQVVITSMTRVASYMPWAVAHANLKQQIAASPRDVTPALALASLAARSGHPDAIVEGINAALAAADRAPTLDRRDEKAAVVFAELLSLLRRGEQTPSGVRSELFDCLARATTSPGDEVAYQFAYGQFLEQTGRLERAVDNYQSVLLDPLLAKELYRSERSVRQANLEAQRRLSDLIEKHGRTVYADYDAMARNRLAQLRQDPLADAREFVRLAEQLPLARNAAAVRVEAARRYEQAGETSRAVSQLRRAYALATEPGATARALSALVRLYETTGRVSLARQWLRRAAREHPGLGLRRDGQTLAADQWVALLADVSGGASSLSGFTPPIGTPRLLRGELMVPRLQPTAAWPRDSVLVREGLKITCLVGHDLEPLWSHSAPLSVSLLSITETDVLLWDGRREMLTRLDAQTGKPLWETLDTRKVFNEMGDPEDARAARRPREQRRFLNIIDNGPVRIRDLNRPGAPRRADAPTPTLVDIGPDIVVVARHDGRVLGVERETGRVLWRLTAAMDQTHRVLLDQGTLVVAGVTGIDTDGQSGVVMVLDPATGEPMLPAIEEGKAIRWIGVSEDAQLLFATRDMLYCHRLVTGDVAWRLATEATPVAGVTGKRIGPSLLLQDLTGSMLVVDLSAGQFVQRVRPATIGVVEPARVRRAAGGWAILHTNQLTVTDDGGRLLWQDAVQGVPKHLRQMLIGEKLTAVLAQPHTGGQRPAPRQAGPDADDPSDYRLYLFDRETGRLVYQAGLGPFAGPLDTGRAVFLDGRLLVGVGDRTLVIPDAAHAASAP